MKNPEMILAAIKNLAEREDATSANNVFVLDQLRRFMTSNAPDPARGKFDIYKYVSRDEIRPAMCGVYHADGFRVATDAGILVALAGQEYPEHYEGKVIDAKAAECEGTFPNWRSVVPLEEKQPLRWKIDRAAIVEAVKVTKQRRKEDKAAETFVKVMGVGFNPEYLLKLADFADFVKADTLTLSDPSRVSVVYSPDGSVGLLMPVRLLEGGGLHIIDLTPDYAPKPELD
jgi:hypothetical protein